MVTFIIGKSGSGKTKWLIDEANNDLRTGHENIVFIDTDDSHIFTLDHSIRLINAKDFHIDSKEKLYGFLCGIISKDYDIEKMYLDGIYEIIDLSREEIKTLTEWLDQITEEFGVKFFVGFEKDVDTLPEHAQGNAVLLYEA